jgi:hypothetical protein
MPYAAHISPSRLPLRKVAADLLAHRQFPAWIDAAESGAMCPLAVVMPRLHDALGLRLVVKRRVRNLSDVSRGF